MEGRPTTSGNGSTTLDRVAIERVLWSLIRSALPRDNTRPDLARLGSALRNELRIDDGPSPALGLDSLQRLELAALVNEFFHVHEAEIDNYLLAKRYFHEWVDIIAFALATKATHVTFKTSGSIDRPTSCTHRMDHLREEVEFWASRFGDRARIVSAVPAHHIYGFIFTALLPTKLGLPVVDLHDDFGAIGKILRTGDLVITFPERWRYIADSLSTIPANIVGVTSTAPIDAGVARRINEHGINELIDVYGSSETGGIGYGPAGEGSYTLLPMWEWAEKDRSFRVTAGGRVVELQDRVTRCDDRGFKLAGRHDHSVQVGGINVYPNRVAALLRGHPGVQDVRVRLCAERKRLKAFVVPAEQETTVERLRADLAVWNTTTLTVPERLVEFTFGATAPVTEAGKDRDWWYE